MTIEAALKAKWDKYYAEPLAKFWTRMDRSGGPDSCWVWTGPTKRRGYGFVMHKGRAFGAHRLALAGSFDALPDKSVFACHRCDNPPCCNPKHLFWGRHQANVDDCVAKGRKRGAPRLIDPGQAVQLRSEGKTYSEIASVFGVNQSSVAKALKRAALLRTRPTATHPNEGDERGQI